MPDDPLPTPAPNPADPTPASADPNPEPETFSREYVVKLREEAKTNRLQRDELAAKVKQFEDAQLSDLDKHKKAAEEATARAAELETKYRTATARTDVFAAATKANLVDPELAFTLLRDRIEFDTDGLPQNVEALVTKLAQEKPYLVAGNASPAPNPMNPPRPHRGTLTKAAIEKMTPDQINANWAAIEAFLASGG